MNALQVFSNEKYSIRTIEIDGNIWFVAKDICNILGYVNSRDAVAKHIDDDEQRVSQIATPSNGRYSDMTIINESGLYTLIMRSNKPEAKEFRRWVTHEVLPSIRKTGSYFLNSKQSEQVSSYAIEGAKILQHMLDAPAFSMTEETKTIIGHEVFKLITGHECLTMLPKVNEAMYSAGDLAQLFGVSANKIGRIAKKHKLQPPVGEHNELGTWILSKSRYSSHECPTFCYNDNAKKWFSEHSELLIGR